MSNTKDSDDGVHPLDRDYSIPVPPSPRRFVFREARAIYVGVIGLFVGGVALLFGIAMNQLGEVNRTFESLAGTAHRVGMWSILGGGVCVMIGMRLRPDRPRRTRKKKAVLDLIIQRTDERYAIGLNDWIAALEEFEQLVPAALTSDVLRPELGDVFLEVGGVALASLRWSSDGGGSVRLRVRRKDVLLFKQRCWSLLQFLDADVVGVTELKEV